eukprot:1157823-Pelagomonas_calceolata.AAC.9
MGEYEEEEGEEEAEEGELTEDVEGAAGGSHWQHMPSFVGNNGHAPDRGSVVISLYYHSCIDGLTEESVQAAAAERRLVAIF